MKFIYLLFFFPLTISPCCWKKEKKLVRYPVITSPAQPTLVRIANINELVVAFNALQMANRAPSISISPLTPLPESGHPSPKRNVTPELVVQESIVLPDGPTFSRLQRSHALIEGFYTYPQPSGDEKVNK